MFKFISRWFKRDWKAKNNFNSAIIPPPASFSHIQQFLYELYPHVRFDEQWEYNAITGKSNLLGSVYGVEINYKKDTVTVWSEDSDFKVYGPDGKSVFEIHKILMDY